MIKNIFILLLVSLHLSLFSQKVFTADDVLLQQNMVWYGLDFSHSKFIGEPSIHGKYYKEPAFVVKHYFKDWNTIPMKEGNKFDIAGSYEKVGLYYDVDSVLARNSRYHPDSLISQNFNHLINPEIIPEIVKSYNGVAKEGLGMAFIVETYDHTKDKATYYSVIFDIASKKIFYLERITGIASGGSLKTFWAGAFRNALDENKKAYKDWKKEILKKKRLKQ